MWSRGVVLGIFLFWSARIFSAPADPQQLESALAAATGPARGDAYFALVDYYRLREPDKALKIAHEALASLSGKSFAAARARIMNEQAYAYSAVGNYAEALRVANEAKALARELGRQDLEARAINNIGSAYYFLGLWEEALRFYLQSLAMYQQLGQTRTSLNQYNNIGNVFVELGRYQEARNYYQQAANIADAQGLESDRATSLGNIGFLLQKTERCDEALDYLTAAAEIFQRIDDSLDYLINLQHLAVCKTRLGDFAAAQRYLDEASSLADSKNMSFEQPTIKLYQAQLAMARKQPEQALSLAESGLAWAARLGKKNDERRLLEFLVDADAGAGENARALAHYRRLTELNKALFDQNMSERIALLQVSFDSERKQQQIALLQRENELKASALEKERVERNQWLFFATAAFCLCLLALSRFVQRRELRRAEAVGVRLRELDALKDQLLANTSHELRTPLNGIVGLSEQLLEREQPELPRELRATVETIAECGRSLSALVADLLDLAQIKEGRMRLEIQPVSVFVVAQQVIAVCQPLAERKGLKLENAVPRELPDVAADPDRLQQILSNLIGNAIKFSSEGVIRVGALLRNARVIIEVSDTGFGIPEEHWSRIFGLFEQGDGSTTRRHGGAGLGLAICKQLVELHQGQISLDSVPGEGSCFRVSLPVALRVSRQENPGSETGG